MSGLSPVSSVLSFSFSIFFRSERSDFTSAIAFWRFGVVVAANFVAELVDALREAHAVLALAGGDGEQHLAHVGARRDVGPRR